MDKQKVNEAIWEYRRNNHYENNPYQVDIMDAFGNGANWLMQQPLFERLTDEEKEKILEIHTTNASITTESNDKVLNAYSTGVMTAIERIFGKDLFKDK